MERQLRADLHCHSTASDGSLAPLDVWRRAADQGVQLLALTDHDSTAGTRELLAARRDAPGPQVVAGVEYSCVWKGVGIHVVGLGLDLEHPLTLAAEQRQTEARRRRAELIAARLERKGFEGIGAAASKLAGSGQIGRPHFARAMVASGRIGSVQSAFDQYLGAGKIGDVKNEWPELEEVVHWISGAGGIAALAHPLKYRLTNRRLRMLVQTFAAAGGEALEVVSGRQPVEQSDHLANVAAGAGLLASEGSDFHAPGSPWRELGQASPLPDHCDALGPVLAQRLSAN